VALTLQKQTVNIVLDQGCTFEKVITAQNSASQNVTISTGTCAAKMRQSYYSSNNITTLTTAVAGSNCTISLTATQTAAISPGNYVYDVEYTQSDTVTVERVAEGIITISAEATK
jgi:hypothetical protein|tara:strand:- start:268 stop:612 length:345 start_codon:yes stop_codon:yes gene_type:complete